MAIDDLTSVGSGSATQPAAPSPQLSYAGVDFQRDVYCLLGLPIDAIEMGRAVRRIREAALGNTRCFVSTVNLNFLMAAARNPAFRASVLHSDLCTADGMPLVWIAKLLGLPIRERVAGADLFEQLAGHPGPPLKVYFFGGPDGVAAAACKRLNDGSTGLRCVGIDSPGFGSVEEMSSDERIDRINQSGAQFLVVALGAAKGQAWIELNRARLVVPVLCHLGAVVNFAAGTVRRAPRWLQATGGEWFWRVLQEPTLWRRYWADGVSLAHTLWGTVLPLWIQRRREHLDHAPPPTRMAVQHSVAGTLIELAGVWHQGSLAPLRKALTSLRKQPGSVTLKMAEDCRVDQAFIGLLMLAHGASQALGQFSILCASTEAKESFERNLAGYLLAADVQ